VSNILTVQASIVLNFAATVIETRYSISMGSERESKSVVHDIPLAESPGFPTTAKMNDMCLFNILVCLSTFKKDEMRVGSGAFVQGARPGNYYAPNIPFPIIEHHFQ
jgi:hypothetical protein